MSTPVAIVSSPHSRVHVTPLQGAVCGVEDPLHKGIVVTALLDCRLTIYLFCFVHTKF